METNLIGPILSTTQLLIVRHTLLTILCCIEEDDLTENLLEKEFEHFCDATCEGIIILVLFLSKLLSPAHWNWMQFSTITILKQTNDIILDQIGQVLAFVVPDKAIDENEKVFFISRLLSFYDNGLYHSEELLTDSIEDLVSAACNLIRVMGDLRLIGSQGGQKPLQDVEESADSDVCFSSKRDKFKTGRATKSPDHYFFDLFAQIIARKLCLHYFHDGYWYRLIGRVTELRKT